MNPSTTDKIYPLSSKTVSRLGFDKTELAKEAIAKFCRRWKIEEFYLFGSVLRDDFSPESDIDVMVKFARDVRWGWTIVDIAEELETIFKRKIDFIFKESIEKSQNWIRQENILGSAKLVYAKK